MADKQPTFDDDIATASYVITEFRNLLAAEISKLEQERNARSESFSPQHHAHLCRMRIASDTFLATLSGHY
jgi:hypothetical protein